MPIPSDQIPIGEGLDPSGNSGATFFISQAVLDVLQRDGPEWKLDEARFIPETVKHPDAIFRGLLRPGQEESLCYSVRPTHDPDDEENPALPRYGFAFLIFARSGIGGYVVFDWEWREEDADAPGHPSGWGSDFERRSMAQDLIEYLKTHPAQGFRPVPHYFPEGDFVTYYFRNDPSYAQRVDDLLTVFLAFDTKELVGCKIKGVRHILQTAGDFGIGLDAGTVQLGFFFFVGASLAKEEMQKKRYEELRQKASEVSLDRRLLQTVSLAD